jgi:hypothetical protein
MNPVLAFLGGGLIALGLVLAVLAFRPPAPKPAVQNRPRKSLRQRWAAVTPRTRTIIVLGVIAGIVAAVISNVLVLIVIVPIAVIGIPVLLGKPDTRESELLSALEAWSRSLSAASATGKLTLRDTISVTRTSTPEILRPGVDRMVQRMATSWTDVDALQAFATEMDSAWVDEVTVYLIQAASFTPRGLAEALEAIADNLADQVKLRGDVYKERARPRRAMVQIAWITGITVALVVLFARTPQLAPFSTPIGQLLLTGVLAFMAVLFMAARRIGRMPSEPRFLLTGETETEEGEPR